MAALPPVVPGGMLVVPMGLLATQMGKPAPAALAQVAAARARAVIMDTERPLGFAPTAREVDKLGYDTERRVPGTGQLRCPEMKGRVSEVDTATVTRSEVLYSLNKPEDFSLAIVEFQREGSHGVHDLRHPFHRKPEFGVINANCGFAELRARAKEAT